MSLSGISVSTAMRELTRIFELCIDRSKVSVS
jgi:hypothetical protein